MSPKLIWHSPLTFALLFLVLQAVPAGIVAHRAYVSVVVGLVVPAAVVVGGFVAAEYIVAFSASKRVVERSDHSVWLKTS